MRWLIVPLVAMAGAIVGGFLFGSPELTVIGLIYLFITWLIIAPNELFP